MTFEAPGVFTRNRPTRWSWLRLKRPSTDRAKPPLWPKPVDRRHCMVVFAYYPLAETRVQRQAEILVNAGYTVDVICLRGPGERSAEHYRGVDIHRLPVRFSKASLPRQFLSYLHFFTLAGIRLTKLHLRHPYPSIQVHNLPDFLVFCAVMPKLQGAAVLLDLHDLMPEFFTGRFGSGRKRLLNHLIIWQEQLACRFADHVITVSDHWRQSLIRRGVPKDKCSVVMNVADDGIFAPRVTTPVIDPSYQLIYHGTVTYRYGLDLAIRAVGLVADEIPEIELTILGGGDQMSALIGLHRELRLQRHIHLRNEYVLAEHLPDIISEADLGIVPYRNDTFTDGLLPTKLMEYAALGLPCIAARTTAIEAYFRDTMVEFFHPNDAEDLARCIRNLRDPQRRAVLARRSRNFTRRYNWNSIGANYVALVNDLANVSAPARPGHSSD
jgi:glycosyltransferase involved in cell wall biosynthesis